MKPIYLLSFFLAAPAMAQIVSIGGAKMEVDVAPLSDLRTTTGIQPDFEAPKPPVVVEPVVPVKPVEPVQPLVLEPEKKKVEVVKLGIPLTVSLNEKEDKGPQVSFVGEPVLPPKAAEVAVAKEGALPPLEEEILPTVPPQSPKALQGSVLLAPSGEFLQGRSGMEDYLMKMAPKAKPATVTAFSDPVLTGLGVPRASAGFSAESEFGSSVVPGVTSFEAGTNGAGEPSSFVAPPPSGVSQGMEFGEAQKSVSTGNGVVGSMW